MSSYKSLTDAACDFQALFAGSIPEIIDIVKTFPKYNGTYLSDRGRRHVLIFRVSFPFYQFCGSQFLFRCRNSIVIPHLFSFRLASILKESVIEREMFRLFKFVWSFMSSKPFFYFSWNEYILKIHNIKMMKIMLS